MSDKRFMLFLVTAGILWGTGGLAGALLQQQTGLHPLAVAAYRLLIGGLLATLALIHQLNRLPRTRAAVRRLFSAGALLAVFQASYFGAVAVTSVSLATLVAIGSSPVIVAAVTAIRERKMPRLVTSACVVLAVLGLALLAGAPSGGANPVLGIVLSLTAGGGFATFTLINRHPVAGLSAGTTISLGLLTGGLLLLPAALPFGMELPVTVEVLGTAAFLGAVPTAIAYGSYFLGLRGASPVVAALTAMLEPLTATVLAALFFGDKLGTTGIVGALILGFALVLSALSGSAESGPQLPATRSGAEVGS